jgi:uridine phosphorylase
MVENVMRQPHTLIVPNQIEPYVLLIGGEDPPLVIKIVKEITDRCQEVVRNGGFLTYACVSQTGTPFTLGITGVGPSATEIATIEYASCGARLFLRAGTSGALAHTSLQIGDVVITKQALRYDGVSDLYVKRNFKAVASHEVRQALVRSARKLRMKYSVGVTLTSGAFYAMSEVPPYLVTPYHQDSANRHFEPLVLATFRKLVATKRALNIEMETATVLTISRIYGLKAGAVCGISSLVPGKAGEQTSFTNTALKNAILIGVAALDYLRDKQT